MPSKNAKDDLKSEKRKSCTNLYVKRAGKLMPLSQILQQGKRSPKSTSTTNEIVYVYHRGKLITLGGSLNKVNPKKSLSIRARVALPFGHQFYSNHPNKKVKVVKINEDMAEFALTALKTPNQKQQQVQKEKVKEVTSLKPSKENILDILSAKLSLDEDAQSNTNSPQELEKENSVKNRNGVSKIMWNQDDVLKKGSLTPPSAQSKALRKNINRFPSLSREMKRLSMNYIKYDQVSNVDV